MKALKTMRCILICLVFVISFSSTSMAQTASTGALAGTVTDPSGAVIPGASVTATNESTGESRSVVSGTDGSYNVPLLAPGSYRVGISNKGFKTSTQSGVSVTVTETTKLNFQLEVGAVTESVVVQSEAQLLQTDSSTLGRATEERVVQGLPLVTRNYTQILGLSPGIVAPVNNARQLGRGNSGLSGAAGDVHVNGARAADNNFQMNGVQINDLAGAGGDSGGVAIPNPDAIQEFKAQTALYDASFGRSGGANVNVITKSGSNQFHGDLFYFLRNKALNANDFFFNVAGQPKPVLSQNQFGGTLGGPIKKDKLFFFGSYQGTRQKNGASGGCSSSALLPPFTDDRSAAAIGAMFAGRRGALETAFGGVGPAIQANGSNINPVALAILQKKLPDGSYLIPTPQTIDPSRPFDTRGFSVFSSPCTFDEDQEMINADYLNSQKSKFSARYFIADSSQNQTLAGGSVPGFSQTTNQRFQNATLSHTYTFGPSLFNEAIFGFHRVASKLQPKSAFSFSSVGSTVSSFYDDLPYFVLGGCCNLGGNSPISYIQNNFSIHDSLSWVRGLHTLRFGGGLSRLQYNSRDFRFVGQLNFQSWPDFLMGLDAAHNGTGPAPTPDFSNIIASVDFIGLPDRNWRVWEGDAYAQDDFKLSRNLTINLGVRYERLGHLGEDQGRNSVFDIRLANPTPPAGGTLQGFVVASNYPGTVPTGVTQANNDLAIDGTGQNRFGPRLGFAWKIFPKSDLFVLRGGYGIYYSRIVGSTFFQSLTAPPFGQIRISTAQANANANLQFPFGTPPSVSSFPSFRSYSPSTSLSVITIAHDFQPPITQQWGINLQTQFKRDYLLEVGYVGTRGTKLIRTRDLNQALLASTASPIRGVTTNTVANINQRVAVQGFPATNGIRSLESAGSSWYNGLQASLTKRFSKGLQFLASYTFARAFDTDGINVETLAVGGTNVGDQNDERQRYGPSNFNRDHRFVVSWVYELPGPKNLESLTGHILGGWSLTGVGTFQSGRHLTLTGTNANNVFGITSDRVQLAPGCTYDQLVTTGSVQSRLNNYFNPACLLRTTPSAANPIGLPVWTVIGNDGIGTGFGNSGVGIVTGPGQHNFDIALVKRTRITEKTRLELRAEFFNAFNTPQFSDPNTVFSGASFGTITSTSVNPRIIQLAAKFLF